MNYGAGKYIDDLLADNGYSQSDLAREIGVQRQILSYVILGKRDLSISLAVKIESFFSLPEGKLLKLQAEQNVKSYKQKLKNELVECLLKHNAFWSYSNISADNVSDEELIEKTFVILDLNEISRLFELYSKSYIKQVWIERMVIQGDYLFSLNVMIAMYYFGIRNPEKYLAQKEREHIKMITANA
ncbi:MAG: helix-turn-helix transcriptional regulator [Tidjanibacter sp.]|nr:helix-turn-helix transcriptional regulator [Tidjanibacter sp.]